MSYHRFSNDATASYGSFETFHIDGPIIDDVKDPEGWPSEPGWYWWACYPGCLPDGDPMGPFETEQAAIDNANDED